MPHKHKRKRDDDDSQYELPPAETATPLPVSKGGSLSDLSSRRKRTKRTRVASNDDTPAAFRRLMAFQAGVKPKSGLDNGYQKPKKKASKNTESAKLDNTIPSTALPKIHPEERMNDFSARVDAALPLTALPKKNPVVLGKDGPVRRLNKATRRQHNMQKEWREIDARWKSKVAEAREEAEDEYNGIWGSLETGTSKKKKRKRGQGGLKPEGDPWAAVGKAKQVSSKLVGLHDVVQDVPKLTVVPKEKMRARNNVADDIDNIPLASGSLKRREELGNSRKAIIKAYRAQAEKQRGIAIS